MQPFPPGKLPGDFLQSLISRYAVPDERMLIGPQVGADAAAIAIGDSILVLKSDPITFPTPNAARYLVNVNANDIACMGAIPRWLLVSALLPETDATETVIETMFQDLSAACQDLNITLAGGHTEITIGIDRPILTGLMIGETDFEHLYDPRSAEPGDAVLLCNGIAIEGTSILANDASPKNLQQVPDEIIRRAKQFYDNPGISVVPAASALRNASIPVRGMHDPTEGGLATALSELARVSGNGIEVDLPAIHTWPETSAICAALGIEELGLIASGALLVVLPEVAVETALDALNDKKIQVNRIGTMLDSNEQRMCLADGSLTQLPVFEVDEIARYFSAS